MMEDEFDQPFRFNPEVVQAERALDLLVLLSQADGAMESMFMARGEGTRLNPVRRAC